MKNLIYIPLVCAFFIIGCNTPKTITSTKSKTEKTLTETVSDTVSISNDKLEYEIIIIEPGFSAWLAGTARSEGFYSQEYMEARNLIYVNEWNNRVRRPQQYRTGLYEMQIDYQPRIDYGYEVNYKLYNYFIYFQLTYNEKLGPFVPRI